jgi:hypothetical protein
MVISPAFPSEFYCVGPITDVVGAKRDGLRSMGVVYPMDRWLPKFGRAEGRAVFFLGWARDALP